MSVASVWTRRFTENNLSMNKLKYFLVLVFIAVINAQHIVDSPCPERPVEQNFDIVKVIKLNFIQLDQRFYFLFVDSSHLVFGMMFCDTKLDFQ